MNEASRLLSAAVRGDSNAAAELLPLVYDQLRKLAAQKMAQERVNHTLSATALVHEAYLRLIGSGPTGGEKSDWNGQGHFFAAASESMRRILVDHARRKSRIKHGGKLERVELPDVPFKVRVPLDQLLSIDQALDGLAEIDRQAAEIVKIHYFVGMTIAEAAAAMNISERTAFRKWNFARTWLFKTLDDGPDTDTEKS